MLLILKDSLMSVIWVQTKLIIKLPKVMVRHIVQEYFDRRKICLVQRKIKCLHSPNRTASDWFPYSDLNKMHARNIFSDNEEAIAKTETYFVARDKSDRCNQCIVLDGNYNV